MLSEQMKYSRFQIELSPWRTQVNEIGHKRLKHVICRLRWTKLTILLVSLAVFRVSLSTDNRAVVSVVVYGIRAKARNAPSFR